MRAAIYPGQSIADAKREIEPTILDAGRRDPFLHNDPPEVVYYGFKAEGYVLDNAEAQIAAFAAAHRRVFGSELETIASTAITDARFFGHYGNMPALVYGPRSEFSHGFDERVDLDSLRYLTKTLVLFFAEWCSLTAAPEKTP